MRTKVTAGVVYRRVIIVEGRKQHAPLHDFLIRDVHILGSVCVLCKVGDEISQTIYTDLSHDLLWLELDAFSRSQ